MSKLAIVHSNFALVESLNTLVKEMLPGVGLITLVDDTLLSYAREPGVDDALKLRAKNFFRAASDAGADAILNVCSSVGETVDAARPSINAPILKIDEPTAEEAVARGQRIAVLAMVESTLEPTCRLLQRKAAEQGREVQLTPRLCEGAFDALMAGKTEEHDRAVAEAVLDVAKDHDVIVLAQAPMARLVPQVEGRVEVPVLSSPKLAMQRLATMLNAGEHPE
jgi:Asp/Glu/hydantoin racemase